MKIKHIFLMPFLLMLAGCDSEIEGTLTLAQELTVLETVRASNEGGFPGGRPGQDRQQELKLPAGQHEMSVSLDGSRKIVFEVEGQRNKTHKIVLKIARGTIPERSGSFAIPSAMSGQPFDVVGAVNTVVTESELMRDREQCTYQRPVNHCGPDGRGRTTCWTDWQTVWGYRRVEFFNRTTTQTLEGEISATGMATTGAFAGDRAESERIYTYTEQCF